MPTLLRLLAILVTICALVFGGMIALVKLVHVERRTIIVDVPLARPAVRQGEKAGGTPGDKP